jgi:hypothetical protein
MYVCVRVYLLGGRVPRTVNNACRLESVCECGESEENDGNGKDCSSVSGKDGVAVGGKNGVVMGDVVVGRWM